MHTGSGVPGEVGIVSGLGVPYAAPLQAVQGLDVSREGDALIVHASKLVDASDPYLPGHFPQFTIFPGVFILEAAIQAVTTAVTEVTGREPRLERLASVRFVAPLFPGDVLTLDATARPIAGDQPFEVRAACLRNGAAAAAHLKLGFVFDAEPHA